jgi:hypothetical protein
VRKLTAPAMIVFLCLLVILNVRQAFLYQEELVMIESLERQQQQKFEENRKIRTGIAILESPQRLDSLADQELGLDKALPGQTVLILTEGSAD